MTKNGDRLRAIARGLRHLSKGRDDPRDLDLKTYALQLDDLADQIDTFKATLKETGVLDALFPTAPTPIQQKFEQAVRAS